MEVTPLPCAVSNSTALIYLARCHELKLLQRLFKYVLIPRAVYVEVVERGLAEGRSDAVFIEDGVEDGWIRVKRLDEEHKRFAEELVLRHHISAGEAEAIALGHAFKRCIVILDEKAARHLAETLRLKFIGTVGVLKRCLKTGILEPREFVDLINALLRGGFRLDSEVVSEAMREAILPT